MSIFFIAILLIFGCSTEELDSVTTTDTSISSSANFKNTNLALGKPTSQSSTGYNGVSSRAVDGDISGNWRNGSVTHTNNTFRPWWQVQLGENYQIGTIKIWNRTNCCSGRLSNFDVFVYNLAGELAFKTTIEETHLILQLQ